VIHQGLQQKSMMLRDYTLSFFTQFIIGAAAAGDALRPDACPALLWVLAIQLAELLMLALQYANIESWGNLFVGSVAFSSVVTHTAVFLEFQPGPPRIFLFMARDGLLPKKFIAVPLKYRTPCVTTILTGIAVGVTSMFTIIDEMVNQTNIGRLSAFVLVCTGVLILPDCQRE
jgi:amino acid transporter